MFQSAASSRAGLSSPAYAILCVAAASWALGELREPGAPARALEFEPELRRPSVRVPRAMAAGDFDANGVPDVAVAGALREVEIHLNAGESRFLVEDLTESPRDLHVADIDADGRDDLLVLYSENRLRDVQPELAVLRNIPGCDAGFEFRRMDLDIDGMVRLIDPVLAREVRLAGKITPRFITTGRISARPDEDHPRRWEPDDFPEIIVVDHENRIFVLANEHGRFNAGLGYRLGVEIHDLHLAPLDDNSTDDLLVAFEDPWNELVRPAAAGGVDRPGGALLLYSLNTPDALIGAADRFYLRYIARSDAVGTAVTTVDYDFDGDEDIVFTWVPAARSDAASARAVSVRNVFNEIADPFRDPGLDNLLEFDLVNPAPVDILTGDFDGDFLGDVLIRFENERLWFAPGHRRQLLFAAGELVDIPQVFSGMDRRTIAIEQLDYHSDTYLDLVITTSEGTRGSVEFLKNSHGGPVETILCGDVDGRPGLSVGDGVFLLEYLFSEAPPPPCAEAADVNGDGFVELGDALHLLWYLFRGGPEPERWNPRWCAP